MNEHLHWIIQRFSPIEWEKFTVNHPLFDVDKYGNVIPKPLTPRAHRRQQLKGASERPSVARDLTREVA